MLKKLFLLFLIPFSITGCGFHLSGSTAMPKDLHTLYVTGSRPNSPFVKTLRRNLADRGIKMASDPKQAPFTLYIQHSSLASTQTSIASSQQIRQYTVTFSSIYKLQSPDGTVLFGPMATSSSATQTMQANQLLTNTYQIKTTEQQLQQQVITLMLYRLSARDTLKAINKFKAQKHVSKKALPTS